MEWNVIGWVVIGVYTAALSFIFCYSVIQFHLVTLYLLRRKKFKKQRVDSIPLALLTDDLPFVTIQLPVFNELYVVERLLDAMLKIDYPKDKFEVQVLDDSNDETTKIIQEKIDKEKHLGVDIQLIRRPERIGFKAGALQYGLELAKGKYVAIFDADFIPSPDFLRKTIPHLEADPKLGVVQTRWGHINENYSVITRMQAFGLDAHFTIEQVGRNVGGHFINFNGTGGVWRNATIVDAGNWQPDTLTEDLDLSYRAQIKGWKFKYLEDFESPAELPATMNAVKSQQFRWNKGGAESAVKNMRNVLKTNLPFGTKLHGVFHLLNSAVFLGIFVSSLFSIPVLIVKNHTHDMDVMFKIGTVFMFSLFSLGIYYSVSFFRIHGFSVSTFFRFLITYPVFLSISMGLSLHNAIAVIEGYMGKKTPFIRTPKFNITDKKDKWIKNVYLSKKLHPVTFFEGLLILYFLFGIGLGVVYNDFGLLPFHAMLVIGYSFVFFFSVKHARFA